MTVSNLFGFAKSGLAAAAAVAFVGSASAATISWGSAFSITSASDIDNSGSAFLADSMGGGTPTVNGVVFQDVLDTGPFFDPNIWTTSTGDAGLDAILQSHDNFEGPNGPYELTLTGLSIGTLYQVQYIATHDIRTCCSTRTSTLGDGNGNLTGPSFTRSTGGSAIGTFTADGTTQLIEVYGDIDPAIAGIIVRVIPEPGSLALLGLGGLAMLRRRR
jgi:hypothetical protein